MAQGRSPKVFSMINWIRTSALSIKKSLSSRWTASPRRTESLSENSSWLATRTLSRLSCHFAWVKCRYINLRQLSGGGGGARVVFIQPRPLARPFKRFLPQFALSLWESRSRTRAGWGRGPSHGWSSTLHAEILLRQLCPA